MGSSSYDLIHRHHEYTTKIFPDTASNVGMLYSPNLFLPVSREPILRSPSGTLGSKRFTIKELKPWSKEILLPLPPENPTNSHLFTSISWGSFIFFFGVELTSAWIVQLILGVVSTFLVYAIAKRYISQGSAFMAAVMFTFYGGNWFYECTLYRASLVTLLHPLSLLTTFAFRGATLYRTSNRKRPIAFFSHSGTHQFDSLCSICTGISLDESIFS